MVGRVAQVVEQRPFKAWVAGSNPAALTNPQPACFQLEPDITPSIAMITIRCSALLFDLDGVLIDSTPAVARVWSRWAVATRV